MAAVSVGGLPCPVIAWVVPDPLSERDRVSGASLGTVSDICLADVTNVCAVSDTCPLSRSLSPPLTDTSTAVDGKVTTLSDTPTEMSDTPTEVSDTTTAVRADVSAACVRLSGLSATGADVSERFGDARRCPVEVERVSAEELGQPMLDGGGQFRVGGGDAP